MTPNANMQNSKPKNRLALLLTFLIISTAFFISVKYVWSISSGQSTTGHAWLTGSSVKFTNYWLESGPSNLNFLMLENPSSIEFPTTLSRQPYTSYPPGTILPIWLICKVFNQPASFTLVKVINILFHYLLTLVTAATTWFMLKRIEIKQPERAVFSILSGFVIIFSPGMAYYLFHVYFSDQAVLLPVAIFLFSEIYLKEKGALFNKNEKTLITIFRILLSFYGMLVDWYFFFVLLVAFLLRVIDRRMGVTFLEFVKKSTVFWIGPLLSVGIWFYQLFITGTISKTIAKGLFRISGTKYEENEISLNMLNGFWTNINLVFGRLATAIAFLSFTLIGIFILINLFSKNKSDQRFTKITLWTAYYTFPQLLQIYIFRNHSIIHQFSTLKFGSFYAIVPFILVPLGIKYYFENPSLHRITLQTIKKEKRKKEFSISFIASLSTLLCILVFGFYSWQSNIKFFVDMTYSQPYDFSFESFIDEHTDYDDVVFSPTYEIFKNNPVFIAVSEKRIYKVSDEQELLSKIINLPDKAMIDLVVDTNQYNPEWVPFISDIAASSIEISSYKDTTILYKLKKDDMIQKIYSLN